MLNSELSLSTLKATWTTHNAPKRSFAANVLTMHRVANQHIPEDYNCHRNQPEGDIGLWALLRLVGGNFLVGHPLPVPCGHGKLDDNADHAERWRTDY